MRIPIQALNIENLLTLKEHNDWNDHFKIVVWPRLLFWLGLTEQFSECQ